MKKLFFIIPLFLLIATPAFGAWTYEQKFNDLTNGDLDGQDNWIILGDKIGYVGNYMTFEGAKDLRTHIDTGEMQYGRSITGITSGIVYFALKVSDATLGLTKYSFRDDINGGGFSFIINKNANGKLIFYANFTGETEILADSVSADTWYLGAIEFDTVNQKARAKVYTGFWSAWSSWIYDTGSGLTEINYINLDSEHKTGADYYAYFDTITGTNPTAPAAMYKCSAYSCVEDDENGTYSSSNCDNACGTPPPPSLTGHLFSVPMSSSSEMLASTGVLGVDLWILIALAMGIPLAFYITKNFISFTPKAYAKWKERHPD